VKVEIGLGSTLEDLLDSVGDIELADYVLNNRDTVIALILEEVDDEDIINAVRERGLEETVAQEEMCPNCEYQPPAWRG